MSHDIAQLKQALPLDALMQKLGHGESVKKSTTCPLHDDTRNSFSVYEDGTGELRWKCHAGCGGGDAIDFVREFFSLPDNKAAIKHYATLALVTEAVEVFGGKVLRPIKATKSEAKPQAPVRLERLTDAACEKIAAWRGLDPAFVKEMSDAGILGLYDGKPAFRTDSGVHFRVPNDGWRFSPGAKNSVLVLGKPNKNQVLFVTESSWDALAIYEASRMPVICTRGAANARLAIDYIEELTGGANIRVVCFPHRDKPGEDFANDLKNGLMLFEFQVKRVPEPYKDYAEYHAARKKVVRKIFPIEKMITV